MARVVAFPSAAAPVVIRLLRLASVCVCSGSPAGVSSRTACTTPLPSVTTAHDATACQASNPMALWAPIGARKTTASRPPISALRALSAATTWACNPASYAPRVCKAASP